MITREQVHAKLIESDWLWDVPFERITDIFMELLDPASAELAAAREELAVEKEAYRAASAGMLAANARADAYESGIAALADDEDLLSECLGLQFGMFDHLPVEAGMAAVIGHIVDRLHPSQPDSDERKS